MQQNQPSNSVIYTYWFKHMPLSPHQGRIFFFYIHVSRFRFMSIVCIEQPFVRALRSAFHAVETCPHRHRIDLDQGGALENVPKVHRQAFFKVELLDDAVVPLLYL